MSVIHIGQPKAASSSLQRALWHNRERLAEAGVVYPDTTTKNHNPVVAEFLLRNRAANGNSRFDQDLRSLAANGSWDRVREQMTSGQSVILSSELLVQFPPVAIDAWLTGLGVNDPRILLCVRQASESVPSSYSQAAKTYVTLPFEMWTRALVCRAVGAAQTPFHLDTASIERAWSVAGPVRTVVFDPRDLSGFESNAIDALGIGHIVSGPFLGHNNASPSAARVQAWQILLREGRPLDRITLRDVAADDPLAGVLPAGGGRFTLVPDVAELLDAAYPITGPVDGRSVQSLRNRALQPAPLTTTGLTGAEWEQAVAMCLADLRERIR